jgi:Tfp pilus assembly protein PilZ
MPHDERRQYPRLTRKFAILFRQAGAIGDSWVHETAHDISAGGLCFLTEEEIKKDDDLDLQIHLPDQHEPHFLKAKVVWERTPYGHSRWMKVFGVEFKEVSSLDKMQFDSAVHFLINADRPVGLAYAH